MNIGITIAITLVFLTLVVGGAIFAFSTIKKSSGLAGDTSTDDYATNTQAFLPFEEISDSMIDLGNHQYRMIIECSSTNYQLKTSREKEVIEASFQRFVNSLTHPIWFFIQTRTIDNIKMLEKLKVDLEKTIEDNPQMSDYAAEYYEEMQYLNDNLGYSKQKKKYVVVPYDEAINLPNLTEEEKYEYSKKEAYQRAMIVANNLASVGIKAKVLNTKELIELIYSNYHKDNYVNAEHLSSKEYLADWIQGVNRQQQMSVDARTDFILYEAQTRIANEIIANAQDEFAKKDSEILIKKLNQLRMEAGAYYKRQED